MKYPVHLVPGPLGLAGARNDAIYISHKTVDLLGLDLIQAVIAHEEGHIERRDGLHVFMLDAIGLSVYLALFIPAFFYLSPGLFLAAVLWAFAWDVAHFAHNYHCEFAADRHAVCMGHGERLIAVMTKLHRGSVYYHQTDTHPSAAQRVERIESMLNAT